MDWASRRKLLYLTSLLLVVGGALSFFIWKATRTEATCYDGIQNAEEVGVDCGGGCAFYCKAELADPKVRWARFFPLSGNLVHAVAYIEHAYPTAAARSAAYTFSFYDDRNNLLTEYHGTTYIGPMGRSAIVETLIPLGNITPSTVRFRFDGDIVWEKIPIEFSQVVVKTDRYTLEPFESGTRLTATLENQSSIGFKAIDVAAILYDSNDNAIAVSKALLPALPAQATTTVYFTWPSALREKTARVEVIPRITPFSLLPQSL